MSSDRWVLLLRGINVGKHNRIAMADLKAAMVDSGFGDVSTYLQSGNIIATGPDDRQTATDTLTKVIADNFGFDIPVVARSADEVAAAVANNPFPEAIEQPKVFHLAFCHPEPASTDGLDPQRFAPDRFSLVDGTLYLDYAEGVRNSKLTVAAIEKALGVRATARNWNTVLKLVDLSQ